MRIQMLSSVLFVLQAWPLAVLLGATTSATSLNYPCLQAINGERKRLDRLSSCQRNITLLISSQALPWTASREKSIRSRFGDDDVFQHCTRAHVAVQPLTQKKSSAQLSVQAVRLFRGWCQAMLQHDGYLGSD